MFLQETCLFRGLVSFNYIRWDDVGWLDRYNGIALYISGNRWRNNFDRTNEMYPTIIRTFHSCDHAGQWPKYSKAVA
jgi:hypothetical protein